MFKEIDFMVSFYTFMFWACAFMTAVATTYARKFSQSAPGTKIGTSPAFKQFQFTYLAVYFMMMVRERERLTNKHSKRGQRAAKLNV